MWGAIIAAPILFGLPLWVPGFLIGYTNIMYGALLMIVLLAQPQGLITRDLLQRIGKAAKSLRFGKTPHDKITTLDGG